MIKKIIIPLLIFSLALLYRASAFTHTYPFWVDEFSTAHQSRLVLQHGLNVFSLPEFERHNITTHFSIALSYALFGENEHSTRLPILLFGSLIPVLVYLLCEMIWKNKYISLPAAFLTIFSYFQIVWSLQARGYVLQQFFLLLSLLLFFYLFKAVKASTALKIAFALTLLLGLMTHLSFIVVILFYSLIFALKKRKQLLAKSTLLYVGTATLLIFLLVGKVRVFIFNYVLQLIQGGFPNNIWYYHSFLWRQYPIIILMSVLGLLVLLKEKQKYVIAVFTGLPAFYLLFFCFVTRPYTSRYILPIFPLFLILSAYFLFKFGEVFFKAKVLGILLTLFVIVNGDKFVSKPKSYYSVNHDMREIANVDYNQVYGVIKEKTQSTSDKVAVIDTWHDRARWYLGDNYDGLYYFTWLDTDLFSNGMALKTSFEVNDKEEKFINSLENFRLIGELSDLEKAMKEYKKGFIWIDDTALPQDVVNYVKENFHKELYIDHYSLDDNPYSIWPATLYSWGFEQ